jgi:hypothetical protein
MGLRTHHHMDRIRAYGRGPLRVVAVDPGLYSKDLSRTLQKLPIIAFQPIFQRPGPANTETKQYLIIAGRVEHVYILNSYHIDR